VSQSPYTPPNAPIEDRGPEDAGSTLKAVAYGVLTDLVGTTVAGVALLIVFSTILLGQGHTPDGLAAELLDSSTYMVVSLGVGLSFTVLGGYVAARVANRREYWHALIVGIIVLVIGELMVSADPTSMPLSIRIIGDLLVVPAALFGAHLRRTAKERAQPIAL
jgi:hypothetical protein